MSHNGFLCRADIEQTVVGLTRSHLEVVRARISEHRCEGCGRNLPETGTARIAIIALGPNFLLYAKCCLHKASGKFIRIGDEDFKNFAAKLMGTKVAAPAAHTIPVSELRKERKLPFRRTAPAALLRER